MSSQRKFSRQHKSLVTRLNLLFFIVFLLFTILVVRLGTVQIVDGEKYVNLLEETNHSIVSHSVPRGRIFDRNGDLVVQNKPLNAITYTRMLNTSQAEKLQLAKNLSMLIQKDTSDVSVPDQKDYWILTHQEEAMEKLSKSEIKSLSNKEEYELVKERITGKDLDMLTARDLEIIAIKRELDRGYDLSSQVVKRENLTLKEFASVSENLGKLPGIQVSTDWTREYPYGNTFRSVIGNVSEGIPQDRLDFYLTRGYVRNDRVGTSQLELQYNDVLVGEKKEVQYTINKQNDIIDEKIINKGARGRDIVLTVDLEFQKKVETIIEEELLRAYEQIEEKLMDRAFVVVMNPKTGEIYSLAGRQIYETEEAPAFRDFAVGTLLTQYEMGSAVKGATLLAGYETGAIQPGTVLVDEPIKIRATPTKKSYKTMGAINDLEAIKRSSNVYMFKTAIEMAGATYKYNQPLLIEEDDFASFRNLFKQFGLGVKTGIDMPNETNGLTGGQTAPGLLLDLAIGQYDLYTPLQLAQYVSTIANNGYRVKPHLLKEVRASTDNNELGPIVHTFSTEVLNRVEMDQHLIERVQEGFRKVMQEAGGTGYYYFSEEPFSSYHPAGKTGTAQTFYYGPDKEKWGTRSYNLTLVGYAPFDDPRVAYSVVVPWVPTDKIGINKYIGRRVLQAYFESGIY